MCFFGSQARGVEPEWMEMVSQKPWCLPAGFAALPSGTQAALFSVHWFESLIFNKLKTTLRSLCIHKIVSKLEGTLAALSRWPR